MVAAEEETRRGLVGLGSTPHTLDSVAQETEAANRGIWTKIAARRRRLGYRMINSYMVADKEEATSAPSLARRFFDWLRPIASTTSFPRPDPEPIPVDQPLDALQLRRIEDQQFSYVLPGPVERLAMNRQLVMECLHLYNSMHPGDEYEPASGLVTKYSSFDDGLCWTHGNFVARRKRSGCLPFLPAPPTLFFFELVVGDDFSTGVVTCTPLDEPVTEAYNLHGFPLGCGTRRNGSWDCICKTCYSRIDVPHPGMRKTFPCGHDKVEKVCEMCYLHSGVLHPFPGEFAFGYREYGCTYC